MYWMFHTFIRFLQFLKNYIPWFIQIRNSFMMLCTMQHIKQWKNCLRIRSMEQGLDISAYFIPGAPGWIIILISTPLFLAVDLMLQTSGRIKERSFSFRLRSCLPSSKSIIFVSWNNSGKIKNLSIMERQHIWKIIMNSKLYWIPSTIRTGLYIRRRHSMERILWSTTLAVTLIVSLSVTVELSAWQMKLLPTS